MYVPPTLIGPSSAFCLRLTYQAYTANFIRERLMIPPPSLPPSNPFSGFPSRTKTYYGDAEIVGRVWGWYWYYWWLRGLAWRLEVE